MKRLILIVGLFFVILSVPILSEATPVFIENPGFEDPILGDDAWQYGIPGWKRTGVAGVWNPRNSKLDTGFPENGNNVAWVATGGSIYQELRHALAANTELTLSVDVGWRLDFSIPSYDVQLWAGNNLLVSESSTPLVHGEFVNLLLFYEVTDLDDSYLGEQIKIVLSQTGTGGNQVNFDNVWFSNGPTSPVPEPSTMFLLGSGLLGLGHFIRKKKG